MSHPLQRLFAAFVLLLAPAPVWAGSDITSFILQGGRARIVQVCVAFMCLGLFIMMRKWTEGGSRRRGGPPTEGA